MLRSSSSPHAVRRVRQREELHACGVTLGPILAKEQIEIAPAEPLEIHRLIEGGDAESCSRRSTNFESRTSFSAASRSSGRRSTRQRSGPRRRTSRVARRRREATASPAGDGKRGPSREHRPVGDDRLCWSTVAGLLLIHVAGAAGVVWIVLNPSLATLALTGCSMWRADCRSRPAITVSSPTAPTAPRPPSAGRCSPSERRRSRTRRCRGAPTIERITPTPTASVTRTRSPVAPGSRTSAGCSGDARHPPTSPCCRISGRCAASGCSTAATRRLPSALGSSYQRSSPHNGATRGVGCSWPGSCVAPSCCKRRSA